MSHAAQQAFIAGVRFRFPVYFTHTKVLEVGSYNVNGTVRDFFDNPALYIGLDLAPGKGVDVVCNGANYRTDERFDCVISTECFEHDPSWVDTFGNMIWLCRSGGLVVFTCASRNRQEHGTPRTTPGDSALATSYYKNLNTVDFELKFALPKLFSWYGWEARGDDLYFYGVKA